MNTKVFKDIQKSGMSFFPVSITKSSTERKFNKKPAVESWKIFQENVPSEELVQSWVNGNFNGVGLVTGKINDITVVDIDSSSAKEWAIDNLPDTPLKVKTIRGGEHWYYKYNPSAPNTTGFKHSEIDVRSDGGFIVASPSDGYKVINGTMGKDINNLPPLPDELFIKESKSLDLTINHEVVNTVDSINREKVRNITEIDALDVAEQFGLTFDSSFSCKQDASLKLTTGSDGAYFNDFGSSNNGGDLVWLIHDYLPMRHPNLAKRYAVYGHSLEEIVGKVADILSIELDEGKAIFYYSPTVERYISLSPDREAYFIGRNTVNQMCLSSTGKAYDFTEVALAEVVYEPSNPYMYDQNGMRFINQFHDRGLLDVSSEIVGEHPYFDMLLESLIEDEKMRIHFMNWLAYFFQNLEKAITAFVFHGVQGSGKTCLMQVISIIFGRRNCSTIGNNELESTFNPWAENKLFINLNEVKMNAKSSNTANKVKALITDKEVQINEKNVKLRSVVNHANFIITSNDNVPVLIEESDRRYNVVYTPNILNQQEWFVAGVYELILGEAPEIAKTLALYEASKVDYNKVIQSNVKGDLQKRSKSNDMLFLDALFSGLDRDFFTDCDIEIDQYLDEHIGEIYITNSKLRELYGEFTGTTISGSSLQKLASHGIPKSKMMKLNKKAERARLVT